METRTIAMVNKHTRTQCGLLLRVSFADSPQGNRAGFQTDSSISGDRFGGQRELKRWVADGPSDADGGLEKTTDNKPWDQFAANEEKFGLKTDYDENIYTTTIDRSHPSYKSRMAKADQMAREIERSNPVSSHVAEERVMDYAGPADGGLDEEEKYSYPLRAFWVVLTTLQVQRCQATGLSPSQQPEPKQIHASGASCPGCSVKREGSTGRPCDHLVPIKKWSEQAAYAQA